MAMKQFSSIEEFEHLVTGQKPFLLMKHSLTCPISANAFEEYTRFIQNHDEVEAYFLAVQEARDLSNHIADTSGIKHESPQTIYFKEGKPVWNTSHWNITYENLKNALGV